VLVLGIAYKKNIDDIRESPSLDVMHVLHDRGARISYADPHAPLLHAADWPGRIDLHAVEPTSEELARHDCVVILTNHDAFDFSTVVASSRLIVDTRNAVGADAGPHVFRLGAPAQTRARKGQEAAA
jgi:UDP-N-acetyl-D-glucosamine dehydrogenase